MSNDQLVNLEGVVGTLQLNANKTIRHFRKHESDFTISLCFHPKPLSPHSDMCERTNTQDLNKLGTIKNPG